MNTNEVGIYLPYGGGFQIPDTIVFHSMAEYLVIDKATAKSVNVTPGVYHASRWLEILGLSAHALVATSGVIIRQRRDNEGTWHARGHNRNTLGIEFLVEGEHTYMSFLERIKTPYLTREQYDAGQEQVHEWLGFYNIQNMKTHHELDPDRKQDPGSGFDMSEFLQEL